MVLISDCWLHDCRGKSDYSAAGQGILPLAALAAWLTVVSTGMSPCMAASPSSENGGIHFSGLADYYGQQFDGKRTASGELHDKTKLTAAHRTLPFGTKIRLVNRRNKKSCVVTVNDRGPFCRDKIIDVSSKAARILGLFNGKRVVDCYVISSQRHPLNDSAQQAAVRRTGY